MNVRLIYTITIIILKILYDRCQDCKTRRYSPSFLFFFSFKKVQMATIIKVRRPRVDDMAKFSSKHGHIHLDFMIFKDTFCNFIHEKNEIYSNIVF